MANTKYYNAELYKHYKLRFYPEKPKDGNAFPVCRWCRADIHVDDSNKEWVCKNTGCRLS